MALDQQRSPERPAGQPAAEAAILIVDDHPANLVALEAILTPLGHRLVAARSGEEALKCLLHDDFAVILLDVMMPGLDGFQTAALARQREKSRSTPVIFLSALSKGQNELLRGYALGAADYLVKPFEPEILRAKVEVFVELYRGREEIRRQAAALRERDRERSDLQRSALEERHARRQAEANEALYRVVAESIPQQVWTATPDGALDFVNPVVLSYFNQSAEAVLGAGWQSVIHPDDLGECIKRWTASIASGQNYEVEFRLRRHDGSYRWHLGRAIALRDVEGRVTRWFGTNTDIDDRKSVEAERQEQQARALSEAVLQREVRHAAFRADVGAALSHRMAFRDILQDCSQAMVGHLGAAFARIWTLNHETRTLELEASAGMYTHIDGGHARVPVGKFKIGLIAQEARPYLTSDVIHDPRVGDREWAAKNQLISFAGYPLIANRRCIGVMAMFSRELLADDTLGALATVADAIAQSIERTRAEQALEARAKELARSNADLERFAYVASHDLQEPLRMVASYTQLLGRRYKGKLDATADEFIAFAIDGANRMQALINDLLSFSRVGTKGSPLQRASLELPLQTALANLKAAIAESGVVITHDPLPALPIDQQQIAQLFQNLIGNGIKFRRGQPPRIHVGAQKQGNEVCFSVRDNGIGINPEFYDRLFVLFQRLHNRSEYPGTGIGLAICKRIIDRHGGRIWVESLPGDGATFFFTLKGGEP